MRVSSALIGRAGTRALAAALVMIAATASTRLHDLHPQRAQAPNALVFTIDNRAPLGQCHATGFVASSTDEAVWLTRRKGPPEALILL